MDCNIVKDLLPLYVDGCCSEESAEVVKVHISKCEDCKAIYEGMSANGIILEETKAIEAPRKRVDVWAASLLQSGLFLMSFALIVMGVYFEAKTDYVDFINGFWAFMIVVPATGFMLSLVNWYFVRLYESKKAFTWSCFGLCVAMIIVALLWTLNHYEIPFNLRYFLVASHQFFYGLGGIGLSVAFCVLSKYLSGKYANMLGKE